jgi:hypothetical protein
MNRSGETLAATALIRKLASLGGLSDEEREAVLALPIHVREVESGHFIVREGDRI